MKKTLARMETDHPNSIAYSWVPDDACSNADGMMSLSQEARDETHLWESDEFPGIVIAAAGRYRVAASATGCQ